VSRRVVASIVVERRAASLGLTLSVSNTVGHNTPVDHVSAGKMELRPWSGVSGFPVTLGHVLGPEISRREQSGWRHKWNTRKSTFVGHWGYQGREVSFPHPPRRARSDQDHSESAGGADRSPEGNPPHRRGRTRESGDAGGGATSDRLPLAVSVIGCKPTLHPDEGAEFTHGWCWYTERNNQYVYWHKYSN